MHWGILLFISLFNTFYLAQHSDCKTALVYDSKLKGDITVPKGHGQEMEIYGHSIYNDHFFTEEHNTLWVYLYFRDSAEFEFELTPKIGSDDFDFMLYKIDRPNFCDYIKNNQPVPIRSNLARKNTKAGGITGMRSTYSNHYSKAGYEPFFSSTLKIGKGDEYYLIIDSPYGGDGEFKLFSECVFIDTNDIPKTTIKKSDSILTFSNKEIKTNASIAIMFSNDSLVLIPYDDVNIKGVDNEDSLIHYNNDSLKIITKNYSRKYEFTVTAHGYEQQKFTYRSFNLKDTMLQLILSPIKIGSVLKFEDIRFVPNKATILKESKTDINKLIRFLTVNEKINVEIGGHVNGLGKNRRKYQSLSKKRAKSVYKELVSSGIKSERLTYIGHGNKKPIYKIPTTLEQSSSNRRVEITVVQIR